MQDLAPRNMPAVASLPTATMALAGTTVRLTTDGHPYYCDGTQWIDLLVGGGARITVSATEPTSPSTNDIWIQI